MCNQVASLPMQIILGQNPSTGTCNFVYSIVQYTHKNRTCIFWLWQQILKVVQNVDKLSWGNLIAHISTKYELRTWMIKHDKINNKKCALVVIYLQSFLGIKVKSWVQTRVHDQKNSINLSTPIN